MYVLCYHLIFRLKIWWKTCQYIITELCEKAGGVVWIEVSPISLNTAQKMKFSNKDFFSKCDHISTFTEKILIGKLHFLCSESYRNTKFFPLESLYKLLNSYCKLEVQLCFLSPLRNWYLILQKKKKMMDFILEFIIICRELLIC